MSTDNLADVKHLVYDMLIRDAMELQKEVEDRYGMKRISMVELLREARCLKPE